METEKVKSSISQDRDDDMAKPDIGLSMLYCLGGPFKKMTEEIPKAQTTCIEIVDDGLHALDKRKVSMLRNMGGSYGLKYTVHAPFAGINITLPSTVLLNATLKRLKRSIISASALDCKMWVFHPGLRTGISVFYPGMDWTRNLKSVGLLFRLAKDYGVEAAVENVMEPFVLITVEDFERFYGEVDDDVGLALDIGHANLIGQVESFLTKFPDKIVHVHAHDNQGEYDRHLGVGYGNINWERVANLLKKARYDKVVIVESVEHVEESMQKLKQLLA